MKHHTLTAESVIEEIRDSPEDHGLTDKDVQRIIALGDKEITEVIGGRMSERTITMFDNDSVPDDFLDDLFVNTRCEVIAELAESLGISVG